MEIASCLIKYCKQLPDNVRHLTAYSDCCGGQNRNENIALTWMYIVLNDNFSLDSIDHTFLEPGHTYIFRFWVNREKEKNYSKCLDTISLVHTC